MCTLRSSWHTMAACHLMFWQPLSFVYCFSVCGPRGWTAFLKWSRGLSFFFLHLLSMNSSEASPAVSASSHTTYAPLRAGFQLNPGIFPSVFLSWSFFTHSKHYLSSLSVLCTQLMCYSSWQDFSPACWHQCQQHAEWLRRPSSFGNGAVLLGQYPFSYCLKTRPSWRLS